MYADLYFKSINFYSPLCWLLKFNLVKINLILLNGDTYWLDPLDKLKSNQTQPTGYPKVLGMIFILNSMEWCKFKNSKVFMIILWIKPMILKMFLIAKNHMNKNYLRLGIIHLMNFKKLSSWKQYEWTKYCLL